MHWLLHITWAAVKRRVCRFMENQKICLASDNWAPAHPLILEAMIEANQGHAPAYGGDVWTERAKTLIQEALGSACKVWLVPTGTGANVFGLGLLCKRHESVLCSDIAHLNYQESGSAEALIGCKLITIPHEIGKITPQAIRKKLSRERAFGKHSTSPKVLSITQPTEVGTLYQLAELSALSALCQEENLLLHIDGSRLYNAAASLNTSLSAIIQAAKPDALSLGGTKAGLIGAEAFALFNPSLEEGGDHLQKQMLQLPSKMRYLSCQYQALFTDNLWEILARSANERAQELASLFQTIPEISLSYPVETNQIFFTAPSARLAKIQEKVACHLWDHEKGEIRLITSWNTTQEDVKSCFTEISS